MGGFAAGVGGFESDFGGEAETGGEAAAVAEVGSEKSFHDIDNKVVKMSF